MNPTNTTPISTTAVGEDVEDGPNSNWQSQYPFAPNFFNVDTPVGAQRLHFVDQGPREGQPLLMLHGNPTWSFYWRHLISGLSDQYRTIALDHIGCGLSDKPVDHDYHLENHINNVCQFVEHLQLENVTLLAHDWGGAIGMGAVTRLKSKFSRIILFNTAAFPPPFIPFRIRVCRWPVFGKVAVQGFNLFARAAITMATERRGGVKPQTAAGLLAPYDNWAHRTAIYQFVKDIPLSPRHRTWQVLANIESELPSLANLPIKLIWGMKDWCFRPECLERLQQHWPTADVTRFEQAGHYVIEDESEAITPLVRSFLSANPLKS